MSRKPTQITDSFIESVCARLARGDPVRRNLPSWGRLHIDRQLPFLCVYRKPARRPDPETDRFVTGEASYLRAPGGARHAIGLGRLVKGIVSTLSEAFGAFLVLEVWSEVGAEEPREVPPPPRFRLHVPRQSSVPDTVDAFANALRRVRIRRQDPVVEVLSTGALHAPGFRPLLSRADADALGCSWLGVSIRPIWHQSSTGGVYPLLRRTLSRRFAQAVKPAFFEFTREKTTHRPPHYHSLGKRAMVRAVREVDAQLADVSDAFDFLLQVTPANAGAAFRQFEKAKYRGRPRFQYRPLPADPAVLKRRLYEIRIERIEDPTIAFLFRGKRRELDLQLNFLSERNSPRSLYGGLQLFGPVGEVLLSAANEVLSNTRARSRESAGGGYVTAEAFAARARAEIDAYRRQAPEFASSVSVRDDVAGLMVSQGQLLVGRELRVPESRVEALLQHEVGTHVLTYHNGTVQPFRQLHCGLAGYEELQEGLAVFSEYLVGGLSRPRLRILAARVVAARCLTDGASFGETFRILHGTHGFERKTAFNVTMRIYRGGGLTKDAIYLRGLLKLLEYVGKGGDLEILFVGKIAAEHVSILRELRRRKILEAPELRPHYLDHPAASRNLQRARDGLTLLDLVGGPAR